MSNVISVICVTFVRITNMSSISMQKLFYSVENRGIDLKKLLNENVLYKSTISNEMNTLLAKRIERQTRIYGNMSFAGVYNTLGSSDACFVLCSDFLVSLIFPGHGILYAAGKNEAECAALYKECIGKIDKMDKTMSNTSLIYTYIKKMDSEIVNEHENTMQSIKNDQNINRRIYNMYVRYLAALGIVISNPKTGQLCTNTPSSVKNTWRTIYDAISTHNENFRLNFLMDTFNCMGLVMHFLRSFKLHSYAKNLFCFLTEQIDPKRGTYFKIVCNVFKVDSKKLRLEICWTRWRFALLENFYDKDTQFKQNTYMSDTVRDILDENIEKHRELLKKQNILSEEEGDLGRVPKDNIDIYGLPMINYNNSYVSIFNVGNISIFHKMHGTRDLSKYYAMQETM